MTKQVVVVYSDEEQGNAVDIASLLEVEGLVCWISPRDLEGDETDQQGFSRAMKSAGTLLVLCDVVAHAREIAVARSSSVPVVRSELGPDESSDERWDRVLKEVARLMEAGVTSESSMLSAPSVPPPPPRPRPSGDADEDKHLELIVELVSEAQVFIEYGVFAKAIERLEKVLETTPRQLEALELLLQVYLELGNQGKAAQAAVDYLAALRGKGREDQLEEVAATLTDRGMEVKTGDRLEVAAPGQRPAVSRFDQPVLSPPTPRKAWTEEVSATSAPFLQSLDLDLDATAEPAPESADVRFPSAPGPLDELVLTVPSRASRPSVPVQEEPAAPEGLEMVIPRPSRPAAQPPPASNVSEENAEFTLILPQRVDRGDLFVVQVWIHQPDFPPEPTVYERAVMGFRASVPSGEALRMTLHLPGMEIDQASSELQFVRDRDSLEFSVVAPHEGRQGAVPGVVAVRTASGPLGALKFQLSVG